MLLFQLFISFLQVGLFSVGGGYAAIPLIQSQIVTTYGWLTPEEFTDLVTIAEMTPGPIAINAATFVGFRIAGVFGAIVATLGCIAPSLFLVSLLFFIYNRYKKIDAFQAVLGYLRPTIVALIASAGLTILWQALFQGQAFQWETLSIPSLLLFLSALFALRKKLCSPILILFGCGFLYLIYGLMTA